MLKLERSAAIARTAEGLAHHNRLVVPEFGVVELRLEQGGVSSLSHRLPGSKTPRDPGGAGTDTFHFAPGAHLDPGPWTPDAGRHDRVKLKVHLYNPFGQIKHAWLELFVRREKSPVWRRELKGDELLDGERELEFQIDPADDGTLQAGPEWDGSLRSGDEHELEKSKRFPDGYVTVEHSPYKLRLTVEGEGLCRAPVAWTYFHVLIDKIELEWGTVDMLPTKREWRRELFRQVLTDGTAPTADQKIHLVSNQFMSKDKDMFDNTLYERYEKRWGRGPKLPLLAKVSLRSCTDAPVLAPRALGHARFLWDWESKSVAPGHTFTDQALKYKVDKTKPKGRNCHKDRGGQRGETDAVVFPAQAGTASDAGVQPGKFPFKVEGAGKPRGWAAFSEAWREGVLACKTGVLFQPSRMAGDKYKLTCYAAHEQNDQGKLRLHADTDAPLPIQPALKVESGEFEIWRRIHVVRYMQKSAFNPMNLGTMADFYKEAFVDLEDKTGGVSYYPAGEWNTRMNGILTGWSTLGRLFVNSAVNQYTKGPEGVMLRTYAEVVAHMTTTKAVEFPTAKSARKWLKTQGIEDDDSAHERFEDRAIEALCELFDFKVHANDGLNVFHVKRSTSLMSDTVAATDGLAHNFPAAANGNDVVRCGFMMLADDVYETNWNSTVETTAAHECGHHFMLPHPKDTGENKGKHVNRDYGAHDEAVTDCLMSYVDGVRVLCGLCRLRMRGWNKSSLKTDGARNEKT